MRTEITPETLRKLMSYDANTGNLFWRQRDESWFTGGVASAQLRQKRWNRRHAGKRAFTAVRQGDGYFGGSVLGVNLLAHRVAWTIAHGAWPNDQIDHINGDRTDNRLINLRDVGYRENTRNRRLRSDNKSGRVGVDFDKQVGRWRAQGGSDGVNHFLGTFEFIDDAIAARVAFEREHDFHPNHGSRANDISRETSLR